MSPTPYRLLGRTIDLTGWAQRVRGQRSRWIVHAHAPITPGDAIVVDDRAYLVTATRQIEAHIFELTTS